MKKLIVAVLFVILGVVGCSSDNPVDPGTTPAYVGVYQGISSAGDSLSFTVSNVKGTAFVTSYFIAYSYYFGGSFATGTKTETNSDGLAKVNGSTFEISLGTTSDEKFSGTFSGDTASGTYKFDSQATVSPITYVSGSYTFTKSASK